MGCTGQYRGKTSGMTSQQRSYIAGLLDGDGSILLQLKPNTKMKFLFRVKAVIIIYQDSRYHEQLCQLQEWLGCGYVYHRNDRISELRVEGFTQVKNILLQLRVYVKFKTKQVNLMLQALTILNNKYTIDDFISVCILADQIAASNYSSKLRNYTSEYVRSELEKHSLVPVTTGVLSNGSQNKDSAYLRGNTAST